MRIAVPYENGNVFGHFGHAEAFKFYDVEDGKITSTQEAAADGFGHVSMVNFMKENGVNAVICGRMGIHAFDGLKEAGITPYLGAEGEADEAVNAYLRGELKEAEPSDCGCGGDHAETQENTETQQSTASGKNAGKTVRAHYRGTFNDGTVFDSSYDRGEPLEFVCGAGQMISGFDAAVMNMTVGEETDVHLMPEEAYGNPNPDAIFTVEMAQLPGSEGLEVGQQVYLQNQFGQPFPVKVTAKDDVTITLDANHEMAGKELNFHIELVEVKD